tara:strand:+ start:40572 stop:41381 length:810 start_codon:yes stop_codon:yes gene_type:complete
MAALLSSVRLGALLRLAAAVVLAAAAFVGPVHAQGRDPILVVGASQTDIILRQGFTGTELLLYGALLDPRGRRAEEDYDIVVVLKGPTEPITLREKEQIAGIWLNAASTDYRSVPSFYAMASSRPVSEIVDPRTAAIYEFGLDYIQLSPTGTIDPAEQARFSSGLVDLRQRQGLYSQLDGAVDLEEGVLYSVRLPIPSNVRPGEYTAETFAVLRGRVIASNSRELVVHKEGVELAIANRAQDSSFLYGLFAISMSLFMGWAAGRLFSIV